MTHEEIATAMIEDVTVSDMSHEEIVIELTQRLELVEQDPAYLAKRIREKLEQLVGWDGPE